MPPGRLKDLGLSAPREPVAVHLEAEPEEGGVSGRPGLHRLLAAGCGAFLYYRHGAADGAVPKGPVDVKNPFSLIEASKFAALFAVVLLAVKIVQENFSPDGLYAVAALAGLTDVDVITLSMADYAKSGAAHVAVIAIVIAAISNTIVKCGMGLVLAGISFAKPLAVATAMIEGHADERGTREYNLALGARRANSVRAYLISQGVDGSRLRAVSFGKERPVALGSDPQAWSQNRRGVTVVAGAPTS